MGARPHKRAVANQVLVLWDRASVFWVQTEVLEMCRVRIVLCWIVAPPQPKALSGVLSGCDLSWACPASNMSASTSPLIKKRLELSMRQQCLTVDGDLVVAHSGLSSLCNGFADAVGQRRVSAANRALATNSAIKACELPNGYMKVDAIAVVLECLAVQLEEDWWSAAKERLAATRSQRTPSATLAAPITDAGAEATHAHRAASNGLDMVPAPGVSKLMHVHCGI